MITTTTMDQSNRNNFFTSEVCCRCISSTQNQSL